MADSAAQHPGEAPAVKDGYKLSVRLDEDMISQLAQGKTVLVGYPRYEASPVPLVVDSVEAFPSGWRIVQRDFKILFKALAVPLKDRASRSKFLTIAVVSLFLTPSGVSVFFMRGWRLELIRRMALRETGKPIAPEVLSLSQLGQYTRDGIRLVAAKALYDLPKIAVLVVYGYTHITMIINWIDFLLSKFFNFGTKFSSTRELISAEQLGAETIGDAQKAIIAYLAFAIIYSLFVTPAFKISSIKYALGKISFAGFFSPTEMTDSFRLYRKFHVKTLEAYVWDCAVTIGSLIAGFLILLSFPVVGFLILPFYNLLFKHWPTAFGYGMLARRLEINKAFK